MKFEMGTMGISRSSCSPRRLVRAAAWATAILLPSALLPSAQVLAQPSEAIVAQAKAEGALTAYIAIADEVAQAWFADFTNEYGIDIEVYRASTATVVRRILTESQAGALEADIAIVSEVPTWEGLIGQNLVAEYTPSHAGEFDASMTVPGRMYPVHTFSYTLAWNTSRVTPEEAKMLVEGGYDALLDPRWAGRLGLVVPQAGSAYGECYRITKAHGWDFWTKLHENKPKFFESVSPMEAQLVQGEIDVALNQNSTNLASDLAKGAPLQFAYPDGAAFTVPFGAGVMAAARHPNAARLFMEWATSADAQSKLSKIINAEAANKEAKNLSAIESLAWYQPPKSYDVSGATPEALAERETFIKRWSEIMGYAQ